MIPRVNFICHQDKQDFTNYVHSYDRALTCMQETLCVHKKLCTVLIPLCKNNLKLPMSHTDPYALRK